MVHAVHLVQLHSLIDVARLVYLIDKFVNSACVVLLVYLGQVVNLVFLVLMFHFVHLAHPVYAVFLTHLVVLVSLVQLAYQLYLVPPWFFSSVDAPGLRSSPGSRSWALGSPGLSG